MYPLARNKANVWAVQRLLLRSATLQKDRMQSCRYLKAAKAVMNEAHEIPCNSVVQSSCEAGGGKPEYLSTSQWKYLQFVDATTREKHLPLEQARSPDTRQMSLSARNNTPSAESTTRMTFNDAHVHLQLLRSWLSHWNPFLVLEPVGEYQRGSLFLRRLEILVADSRRKLHNDDDSEKNHILLDKILQLLEVKNYVHEVKAHAQPFPGKHSSSNTRNRPVRSISMKVSLDCLENDCSNNKWGQRSSNPAAEEGIAKTALSPYSLYTVKLRFVPFHLLYSTQLLLTGPGEFNTALALTAKKNGFTVAMDRGVVEDATGKRFSPLSERHLFEVIDAPFVHPINR